MILWRVFKTFHDFDPQARRRLDRDFVEEYVVLGASPADAISRLAQDQMTLAERSSYVVEPYGASSVKVATVRPGTLAAKDYARLVGQKR